MIWEIVKIIKDGPSASLNCFYLHFVLTSVMWPLSFLYFYEQKCTHTHIYMYTYREKHNVQTQHAAGKSISLYV